MASTLYVNSSWSSCSKDDPVELPDGNFVEFGKVAFADIKSAVNAASTTEATTINLVSGEAVAQTLTYNPIPDTKKLFVDDDWASCAPGDPVVIGEEIYIIGRDAFATIQDAVNAASTTEKTTISVFDGTYGGDVYFRTSAGAASGAYYGDGTVVPNQKAEIEIVADGDNAVVTGTIYIGLMEKGTSNVSEWNAAVTLDGLKLDNDTGDNLSIQSASQALTVKDCEFSGDYVYRVTIVANCNVPQVNFEDCSFDGGYLNLVSGQSVSFDSCTMTEVTSNIQGGNGVEFTDCTFTKTVTDDYAADNFYVVRTNDVPITMDGCTINVDSTSSNPAPTASGKAWAVLWERNAGSKKWQVTDATVNYTSSAAALTGLLFNNNVTATAANAPSRITIDGIEYNVNGSAADVDDLLDKTAGYMIVTTPTAAYLYNDGDVVASTGGTTLYADGSWAGKAMGEAITLPDKTVVYYGFNAFSSILDAGNAAQPGVATTVHMSGNLDAKANISNGQNITFTGTAALNWKSGWFFVGRGISGADRNAVTYVTFRNATITSINPSTGFSSTGFHVSGYDSTDSSTNYGVLNIIDSTIECDYLLNRNEVNISHSDVTFVNMYTHGRGASESKSGEDETASLNLTNGAHVIVTHNNGMSLGAEGKGLLTIDGSTFEHGDASNVFTVSAKGKIQMTGSSSLIAAKGIANNGTITADGTATLDIPTLTGNDIGLTHGTSVKNSTVGGGVELLGEVSFVGNNRVTMVYDFGKYTGGQTGHDTKLIVGAGNSLTMTSTSRYGIGYGDAIDIDGAIVDALTARATLTESDASLTINGGMALQNGGWSYVSTMTVDNAYVILAKNDGYISTNTTKGGNYNFTFTNSVVDATRIHAQAAGSYVNITFSGSDVKFSEVYNIASTGSTTTLTNTVMTVNGTNGNDQKNTNAGTFTMTGSTVTFADAFTNTGTINVQDASKLVLGTVSNTGSINVIGNGNTVTATALSGAGSVTFKNAALDNKISLAGTQGGVRFLGTTSIADPNLALTATFYVGTYGLNAADAENSELTINNDVTFNGTTYVGADNDGATGKTATLDIVAGKTLTVKQFYTRASSQITVNAGSKLLTEYANLKCAITVNGGVAQFESVCGKENSITADNGVIDLGFIQSYDNAGQTYTLTNNSILTVGRILDNNVAITMDSSSILALAPEKANLSNLAITIKDASAFTGVKKLIDMNARYDYTTGKYETAGYGVTMTVDDYKNIVTDWNENFTVIDNDLYLANVDVDEVYVNSDWATGGYSYGDAIEGETGKFYGINAFSTFKPAFESVDNNGTIILESDSTGTAEKEVTISVTSGKTFTITGSAQNYVIPVLSLDDSSYGETPIVMNIDNASFTTKELDARRNATINVKNNSSVYTTGGAPIAKAYFDGTINVDATSYVNTHQMAITGRYNLNGRVYNTWKASILENGNITVNSGATLTTASVYMGGKYKSRTNPNLPPTDPATLDVNGGVVDSLASDSSYYYLSYVFSVGYSEDADGKEEGAALLKIRNGGSVSTNAKGGMDIRSTGVVEMTKGTLTVTKVDSQANSGKITNAGAIKLDVDSSITATELINSGDGSITIDATAFTTPNTLKKVIDLSQTGALTNVAFKDGTAAEGVKLAYGADGDVVVHNISAANLYVNAAWATKEIGEEINIGTTEAPVYVYYGINAFSRMEDVTDKIATDGSDTTVHILSNLTPDDDLLEFQYGDGKVSFVKDGDEPVSVAFAKKGDFVFETATEATITIGEGVTFSTYDNNSDFAVFYGPSLSVYGTISGGANFGALYVYDGDHKVHTTGTIGTGRIHMLNTNLTIYGIEGEGADLKRRYDADVAVADRSTDAQADVNFLFNCSGAFTASDTYITVGDLANGGDGHGVYDTNKGGVQDAAVSTFTLTNTKLETYRIALSKADTEFSATGSVINVTGVFSNASSITLDASTLTASCSIANAGTITLSGASKLTGAITGAGTLKFDGATIADAITASTNAGVFSGTNEINAALSLKSGTIGGTNTFNANVTFATDYKQGYKPNFNTANSKVTVKNANLTAKNFYIGSDQSTGVGTDTVNIDGGAIQSIAPGDTTAIYVRNNGVLYVTNGATLGNYSGNVVNLMDYNTVSLAGTTTKRAKAYLRSLMVYASDFDDTETVKTTAATFTATNADIDIKTGPAGLNFGKDFPYKTSVAVGGKPGKGDGTMTLTNSALTVALSDGVDETLWPAKFTIGYEGNGNVSLLSSSSLNVASDTIDIGISTGTGTLTIDATSSVNAKDVNVGANGAVNITVGGTITAETFTLTNDGTITIDARGFTGYADVITVTGGDAQMAGTITLIKDEGSKLDVIKHANGSVSVGVVGDDIYFNSAWSTVPEGAEIKVDSETKTVHKGVDAFAELRDFTATAGKTLHFTSNSATTAAVNDMLNGSKLVKAKDATADVTVSLSGASFVQQKGDLTIGAGVTLAATKLMHFAKDTTITVDGTFQAVTNAYLYAGKMIVNGSLTGDDVFLNGSGTNSYELTANGDIDVKKLRVGANATLDLAGGDVTTTQGMFVTAATGTVNVNDDASIEGDLTNDGTINVAAESTLVSDMITNTGTINGNIEADSIINGAADGSVKGTITAATLKAGSIVNNNGAAKKGGSSIELTGNLEVEAGTITNGVAHIVPGTDEPADKALIKAANIKAGSITNFGTIGSQTSGLVHTLDTIELTGGLDNGQYGNVMADNLNAASLTNYNEVLVNNINIDGLIDNKAGAAIALNNGEGSTGHIVINAGSVSNAGYIKTLSGGSIKVTGNLFNDTYAELTGTLEKGLIKTDSIEADTVTNNGKIDVKSMDIDGSVTNNASGNVSISVDGLLSAASLENNGTITVTATDEKAWKAITLSSEMTGTGSFTGGNVVLRQNGTAYEYWVSSASQETLYVNSAYTGEFGEKVGEGKFFGINAFNTFSEALTVDAATSIVLESSVTEALAPQMKTLTHDFAITLADGLTSADISWTVSGTSTFESDGVAFFISDTAVDSPKLTFAEGVNFNVYRGSDTGTATYFGYNKDQSITVDNSGAINVGSFYVSRGTTYNLKATGTINTSEISDGQFLVRKHAALNITGTGETYSLTAPQVKAGFVTLQGGVTTLTDTVLTANSYIEIYNRNVSTDDVNQPDEQVKFNVINSTVKAKTFKSVASVDTSATPEDYLVTLTNSDLVITESITNPGTITLDLSSTITAASIANSGTITVDATGYDTSMGLIKLIDVNGAASYTGNAVTVVNGDASKLNVIDGDVYYGDGDQNKLFVDLSYTGAAGTVVDGHIIGFNAFSKLSDALTVAAARTDATTITVSAKESAFAQTYDDDMYLALAGDVTIDGTPITMKNTAAGRMDICFMPAAGTTLSIKAPITMDATSPATAAGIWLNHSGAGATSVSATIDSKTFIGINSNVSLDKDATLIAANATANSDIQVGRAHDTFATVLNIVGTGRTFAEGEYQVSATGMQFVEGTMNTTDTWISVGYLSYTDSMQYTAAPNSGAFTLNSTGTTWTIGEVKVNFYSENIAADAAATLNFDKSAVTVSRDFNNAPTGSAPAMTVNLTNGSTLSVTNDLANAGVIDAKGSTITVGGNVTGTGSIALDANSSLTLAGTLTAATLTNAGTINLSLEAVTLGADTIKLVDITDATCALDVSKINITGDYTGYEVKAWNNDLFLSKATADTTTLYVSTKYVGDYGTDLGGGKVLGVNAFSSIFAAMDKAMEASSSTIQLDSNIVGEMVPNGTDYYFNIKTDTLITASGNYSVSVISDIPAGNMDLVLGSIGGKTLTIDENVTFGNSVRPLWIGSNSVLKLLVKGTIYSHQIWNGATTTVTSTGKLDSFGNEFVIRFGKTITITGDAAQGAAVADRTPQIEANFFSLLSGTIDATDTYIKGGQLGLNNYPNYSNEGPVQLKLNNTIWTSSDFIKATTTKSGSPGHGSVLLDLVNGSTVSAKTYGVFDANTVVNVKSGSLLTFGSYVTNDGAVTIDGATFVATTTLTNNATFTVSGTSLLTIGALTGTITVNDDATLTGSSVVGAGDISVTAGAVLTVGDATKTATSFGAVTNAGEIDIDGASVNLGAITNNGTINMDWNDKLTFSGYVGTGLVNIDMTGYVSTASGTVMDYTGDGAMDAGKYMAMTGMDATEFNKYFTVSNKDLVLKSSIVVPTPAYHVEDVQAAVTAAKANDENLTLNDAQYTAAAVGSKFLELDDVNTTVYGGTFDVHVNGGTIVVLDDEDDSGKIGTKLAPVNTSVTINDGTFNKTVTGADRFNVGASIIRYGNSELTINGGTFKSVVAGGMLYAQTTSGSAKIRGDVTLTINGGSFTDYVYGGSFAGKKLMASCTSIDVLDSTTPTTPGGNVTIAIDATNAGENGISFAKDLVLGSHGTGKVKKDAKLIFSGSGTITVTGQIWGSSSGDYYIINADGTRTIDSSIEGDRLLSFTGFTGTLACDKIRGFESFAAIDSDFDLRDAVSLSDIHNWEIGDSTIGGAFVSDFTGDTLTLTSLTSGVIFEDVSRFQLTKTEGGITTSLFNAVQYKDANNQFVAMNFNADADAIEWASADEKYKLYLANTDTGKTEMRFDIA